jgi:hypothetical protein
MAEAAKFPSNFCFVEARLAATLPVDMALIFATAVGMEMSVRIFGCRPDVQVGALRFSIR